jgi:hypothetical protein
MIQPDDIRRKAGNLYLSFLQTWLRGNDSFFPRIIPADKTPSTDDMATAIKEVEQLRQGSKEALGYGYTVVWREVNSRKMGRNRFPARILFETQADYLRYVGKQQEFAAFSAAVVQLRTQTPALEDWIRANAQRLIEAAAQVEGLLQVVVFFRERPRPDLFARELPIPVDTKFIERHQGLLQEWLDILLPPTAIRADEAQFELRYGLRYVEPHLYVRLLDPCLKSELGFPCSELSLPLHTLARLDVRGAAVFVVENKVNLLTLPLLPRCIGFGALGRAVTLLRHVPWVASNNLFYWGDLDVEGLEILSSLRALHPATRSFLMDEDAIDRWQQLGTKGSGRKAEVPAHLTDSERAAFLRCREHDLRIEQERLPQSDVLTGIRSLLADHALRSSGLKTWCRR